MAETCIGIRGVDSLRHELDRARESLLNTDATIEKLTGRPAFANRQFIRRPPLSLRTGGNEAPIGGRGGNTALFNLAGYDTAPGPPPNKRFAGGGASGMLVRLGLPFGGSRPFVPRRQRDDDDDDDLPHKPSLQSSVVATPKDTKSREDAIAEQQSATGGDVGAKRNRRMFGLLLGTLVRFREDERTKEEQAEKRKLVEQRLEQKQRDERERLKQERQQLFIDRRNHQAKLRALEQKMELVEIHEAWEAETHNLEYFIRTASKPQIFYLPKTHTPESSSKLDESRRLLREIVAERRKLLEEEIEEIMMKEDHAKDDDGGEEEGDDGDDSMEVTSNAANVKSKKATAYAESDLEEDDGTGVAVDCGPAGDMSTAEHKIERGTVGIVADSKQKVKDRLGLAADQEKHGHDNVEKNIIVERSGDDNKSQQTKVSEHEKKLEKGSQDDSSKVHQRQERKHEHDRKRRDSSRDRRHRGDKDESHRHRKDGSRRHHSDSRAHRGSDEEHEGDRKHRDAKDKQRKSKDDEKQRHGHSKKRHDSEDEENATKKHTKMRDDKQK